MKLRIISGNKGGIGKSFSTILLADYILRNEQELLVGDAEASIGQATTWNILRRHIEEEKIRPWSLGDAAGFEKMADDLQAISNKNTNIIVDTGATMMQALTANLDFLSEVRNDLALDVGIVFVVGPMPDSVVSAREFLRAQKNNGTPLKATFLMMSPEGKEQHEFAIMRDEKVLNAIDNQGSTLQYLGTIRQDFFDEIMMKFQIPHKILANVNAGYSFRKRLDMWVKSTVDPISAQIWG